MNLHDQIQQALKLTTLTFPRSLEVPERGLEPLFFESQGFARYNKFPPQRLNLMSEGSEGLLIAPK